MINNQKESMSMLFEQKLPKKEMLIILGILLMTVLPFVNKAYHIDDTLVVYPAKQILKFPFHPFDFEVNWYGDPRSFWLEDNPPLVFYFVSFVILLFGESEKILHISFVLFPIIAVVSMYFLGRRLTKLPFLSSAFLIATSAFLVMSTNIMLDIPLLAFYLASIATFMYGIDRDDSKLKILSGVLIGLAALTKYTGLTLIPLLVVYVIVRREKFSRVLWVFVIPLFMFGSWCIHNLITHGSIHFIEAAGILNFKPGALYQKFIGTLSYLGGATVFPLLIPVLLFTKKKDVFIYAFAFFLAVLLPYNLLTDLGYEFAKMFFIILFLWVALLLLIKVIEKIVWFFIAYIRNPQIKDSRWVADEVILLLWFSGIFIMNVISEYSAARFVLIMLPPVILLMLRIAEGGFVRRFKHSSAVMICGLFLSLMMSISVAYADYSYADVYRLCKNKIKAMFEGKNQRVFFDGHWGFQYYMEKEGFRCFSPKIDNPRKGDILVIPSVASYDMPIDVSSIKEQLGNYPGRHLKLMDIVEYNSWFPVRTMHKEARAGFYSHGWGFLPFAFSKRYLEKFYIWEFI